MYTNMQLSRFYKTAVQKALSMGERAYLLDPTATETTGDAGAQLDLCQEKYAWTHAGVFLQLMQEAT